jgi:acetoacetyl-CoA reductase/3-oxoacyl-[acyl-carrier protein] reductase
MSTAQAAPRFTTSSRALQGRVALVTGGTRGIGAAISRSLGAAGATVAAGYTRDDEAAQRFIKDFCSQDEHHGSVHRGNVGNTDDCERVVQEVIDQHGRLDILVNNAGITSDKPVLKMSYEDWDKVIRVNLSGAFYMSKPALGHMVERGTGRIVNISSVIGHQGNIRQANYASSKSGMFGLTMTLAREAAHALKKSEKLLDGGPGLTVNTVSPGYINTEMVATVPEKVLDMIKGKIPLARLGEPEEIARVVEFLCEDASAYITGQVWAVNGGMEM